MNHLMSNLFGSVQEKAKTKNLTVGGSISVQSQI